ncbi:Gfo/Idh/MocA family oxidoreductase [Exiguobacterium sp. SL14]|nr:Gfo/Idh/MocA family oxidoreductase [Exiguobacterium sp. SL14]MCY1691136.1 Gfo/Idh/MocA family oxidoreductase [Exiguobacterium sp. SL14]
MLTRALDVVVINTPPATHFEYALRALQNQKHVLVEKPFTVTEEETQRLFAEAVRKVLKFSPIKIDVTIATSKSLPKSSVPETRSTR